MKSFIELPSIFTIVLLSIASFFIYSSSHIYFHFQLDSFLNIKYESKAKYDNVQEKRIAIVDGDGFNASLTYLKHVREMFEFMDYQVKDKQWINEKNQWDVIWYHDYIFSRDFLKNPLVSSEKWQVINHVPGSGFYTSKVALATSGLKHGSPIAFELPLQKNEFIKYADNNPETLWVQKDNTHRNIRIKSVEEMSLDQNNSFIQKFVDNPLLIDNRKFDIGIYTVITSIVPLKVYIFNGDALIRFCPMDYKPFDDKLVDKYVVGDDYTPIWKIKSLSKYYNKQHLGMRDSLNAYLGMKGLDPSIIWKQIERIISSVFQQQQLKMAKALSVNQYNARIFELSRFDFVVDDNLNVYLMEANMSPNLSSGHFKRNQLLYEKVLMSVFSLVQIAKPFPKDVYSKISGQSPIVTDSDIILPMKYCIEEKCNSCDSDISCQLCGHCMDDSTKLMLKSTFLEHINRRQMIRLNIDYKEAKPLTKEDMLLNIWIRTKCELDISWC